MRVLVSDNLGEIGIQNVTIIEQLEEDMSCEVIITIGISGNITGTMMLKSDQKSAAALAKHMLKNIHYSAEDDTFSESQQEVIREFMNLISGRTLMILSEKNIDCNLTPPILITGKQIHPSIYNILYIVDRNPQPLYSVIMNFPGNTSPLIILSFNYLSDIGLMFFFFLDGCLFYCFSPSHLQVYNQHY